MPLNEFDSGLTKLMSGMIKWTDKAILDAILEHQFETANMALQAALPNNCLIPDFDAEGKPIYNGHYSVMVGVPMFYLDEVIDGAPHKLHPMFRINGNKYKRIYISKYQNVMQYVNGFKKAYSIPNVKPETEVNLTNAGSSCFLKGKGWHVMTNAEWAGIALWCKKNGTMPKGNNTRDGKDYTETNLPRKSLPGIIYPGKTPSETVAIETCTGTGPLSWYHDQTAAGIADLNGNLWELVNGIRILENKILIIKDNDAAIHSLENNLFNFSSQNWKAIDSSTNELVDTQNNNVYFNEFPVDNRFYSVKLNPMPSDRTFFESLCLLPHADATEEEYGNDLYTKIDRVGDYGIFTRGGVYTFEDGSGVFSVNIIPDENDYANSYSFRAAYFSEDDMDNNIPEDE